MWEIVTRNSMVSRSLEKMLLIAVGLTMVVMVGVPVLLYSMEAISNASQLEAAQSFADALQDMVAEVDTGQTNNTSLEINLPDYVTIRSDDTQLIVEYHREGSEPGIGHGTGLQ